MYPKRGMSLERLYQVTAVRPAGETSPSSVAAMACPPSSEKGVRLAQKMQAGPAAHAFSWEYSYKSLKLAQLLGQLGSWHLSHFSDYPQK